MGLAMLSLLSLVLSQIIDNSLLTSLSRLHTIDSDSPTGGTVVQVLNLFAG